MSYVAEEIASQPGCWRRAAVLAGTEEVRAALPPAGARVAVVGCGTSYYMAQAMAALRESAGVGETDSFAASEFPAGRGYDHVVALTRSGTTTEVLRLVEALPRERTVAVTTSASLPVAEVVGRTVVLDFADERSVVQTRFATTALALWRAHLGTDLAPVADDAEQALAGELDAALLDRGQFTFLGTSWTVGLAQEAALKLREAAQAWTEAYPAMEFRHGPISVIDGRSVVWFFGAPPFGLVDDLAPTGGLVVVSERDPMAHLVDAQRLAVGLAVRAGLDPDTPRNLTRSIVLPA
ncbi:MAG: sugar isomerase [Actinobacteria bacterium]|nr:sugar isomerase [Actinomycetota bacterium]